MSVYILWLLVDSTEVYQFSSYRWRAVSFLASVWQEFITWQQICP